MTTDAHRRGALDLDLLEQERQQLQIRLDLEKSQVERNQLGQFSTPIELADEIVAVAKTWLADHTSVDFLEPALGTGAFFSAFLRSFEPERLGRCRAYEVDPHYGLPAQDLWQDTALNIVLGDFTSYHPPTTEADRFDFIATNPPYVRHHHIDATDKLRLKAQSASILGTEPSGLSGLYTYFIYLCHHWMREGGVAAWLVPSEYMDVNYGQYLRDYLLTRIDLLRIHRFDPKDVQFDDALVSSSVIFFRKQSSSLDAEGDVLFTSGSSLIEPKQSMWLQRQTLKQRPKWRSLFDRGITELTGGIPLGELFSIRRGLATGANGFFILKPEQVIEADLPEDCLIPILPSPRYLPNQLTVIDSFDDYHPEIAEQRFLLSCNLPEFVVECRYPKLWQYLQRGKEQGIHKRYLCSHRSPWYAQEALEPAPIVCTYMGRAANGRKPFRFFRNRSAAVTPNTYLNLYPKTKLKHLFAEHEHLLQRICYVLREIPTAELLAKGRTYGGGLHKLEPNELANLRLHMPELEALLEEVPLSGQPQLFEF